MVRPSLVAVIVGWVERNAKPIARAIRISSAIVDADEIVVNAIIATARIGR
jgi:hypothetical protein